jgi:putative transposase
LSGQERKQMIAPERQAPSISRQCQLMGLSRSTFYYAPLPVSPEDLELMRLIDEQYLKTPAYGSRSMVRHFRRQGRTVNRKRIQRLMRLMGIEAIYPKPHTSRPHPEHTRYPYLLKNLTIDHPDQVYAADITYVPMAHGFMYLAVVMDWYSRKILAWRLSNTLDSDFCVQALQEALGRYGAPEIFNTDQGSQFTSGAFTKTLKDHGVAISMDGRSRCLDNVFVERLWWTMKYHYLYLHAFESGEDLRRGLSAWVRYYNQERGHSALDDRTPDEVYFGIVNPMLVRAA